MCRLSPSCFEEQNKAEGPELWVQQVHASSWLNAQFFNLLRWAELFGIDDHPQRSFIRDVYEALTSRAIPEKQNGRVIPDSEDESAFTFSRLWRTRWRRITQSQSEWSISALSRVCVQHWQKLQQKLVGYSVTFHDNIIVTQKLSTQSSFHWGAGTRFELKIRHNDSKRLILFYTASFRPRPTLNSPKKLLKIFNSLPWISPSFNWVIVSQKTLSPPPTAEECCLFHARNSFQEATFSAE